MKQYHDLMQRILDKGITKEDRTGTGTRSVFGHQMRFDLTEGFPLVTTKRVFWRGVVEELLWMLRGETNVRSLQAKGVTIWDEWADENGELGPVYGKQWRSWTTFGESPRNSGYFEEGPAIDQIQIVLNQLRTNPDSRRMIVSAWNPADVDDMKLPPCHMMFQFYTRPMLLAQRLHILGNRVEHYELEDLVPDLAKLPIDEGKAKLRQALDTEGIPSRYLDCQLYQRSCDVFLGVPFNIASYALLTHLMARQVGMEPGEFVWTGGDTHLYLNHIEQAVLQLTREPHPLPLLGFASDAPASMFDMQFEHLVLSGYTPDAAIKAPVSV